MGIPPPPTFKGKFFGGVQKSVGRLLVLRAEMRSYSTSGICSLLFLIENQYRAMVQLLRNPAFLIVGGGGAPIKQELGLHPRPLQHVKQRHHRKPEEHGFSGSNTQHTAAPADHSNPALGLTDDVQDDEGCEFLSESPCEVWGVVKS